MNQQLKECKQKIRVFLQSQYSDGRLAWLLAHAQSGRLAYFSCCCFIGTLTADHALRGYGGSDYAERMSATSHLAKARQLENAHSAEVAFNDLGCVSVSEEEFGDDHVRRRRIIPMIKAEMRRRERERQRNATVADRAFLQAALTAS
jgi:hypothetical protein